MTIKEITEGLSSELGKLLSKYLQENPGDLADWIEIKESRECSYDWDELLRCLKARGSKRIELIMSPESEDLMTFKIKES